jgi:hypothetical protein
MNLYICCYGNLKSQGTSSISVTKINSALVTDQSWIKEETITQLKDPSEWLTAEIKTFKILFIHKK